MALTKNTELRNILAQAFGDTFDAGTLEIRTAADVVLATITLPATAFGAPSVGVIAKSGTWSATAVGTGIARKAVFISADTLKTGEVTVAETAADMIIDDENIVTGGTVTVTTYTHTVPA